jgi:hypothetical protein
VHEIFYSVDDEFMSNAKIISDGREREHFGELNADGMTMLK